MNSSHNNYNSSNTFLYLDNVTKVHCLYSQNWNSSLKISAYLSVYQCLDDIVLLIEMNLALNRNPF